MRHAAFFVVGHRATKLLLGHFFVRDGLDDVWTGDEHVRSVAGHKNKIGDGRRIDRAARARSHDRADLRNHSAGQRIAKKNFGVACQRFHAFLNPRPAGIIQANYRRASAHGEIHKFRDL